MAKNDGILRQISMQDGGVTVTLGRVHTTVPADQIDSVIRALEAAKMMLGLEASGAQAKPQSAAPVVVHATTPVVVRPAKQVPPIMPRVEVPRPAAAAVVAAPAAPARRGGRRKKEEAGAPPAKQRSRKRVGDALADWFRDNPGWHSTDELLDVVSEERMTDASPKRALMIALGKQRDSIFASDGQGNWKLSEDPAPAPVPQPKIRKKPGRKPGSGKAAAAAAAAPRGKRPTGRPRGRPPKSASADKEGSAVPQEVEPTHSGKVLRVKRGQDRKEALLSPQELEARKQAATAVDTLHFRWDSSSRAERERMRRNLFGDGAPKTN